MAGEARIQAQFRYEPTMPPPLTSTFESEVSHVGIGQALDDILLHPSCSGDHCIHHVVLHQVPTSTSGGAGYDNTNKYNKKLDLVTQHTSKHGKSKATKTTISEQGVSELKQIK